MVQSAPLVSYPDVESRVEALRRDGYVYFPGVLNADEIGELRAAMDRLEARKESFDRDGADGGYQEKHIKCVFNRDAHFLQFLDRPGVFEVARETLTSRAGRRPIECHIIGMTGWVTGPGRPDQDLHVDWLPFPAPGGRGVRPAGTGPGDGRHRALLPRRPVRGAGAHQVHPRQPPGGQAAGRRQGVAWTGRAELCCARRATWSCSGARCGTGARPTAAARPGTCCRCTTPTA